MDEKHKKIIYIAGSGHSGSTLLDIILGDAENAFSIGELNHLFRDGLIENEYCSCKEIVKNCKIWKEVLSVWNETATLSKVEYRKIQLYYDSKKNIFKLIKELKKPSKGFDIFLKDTEALYSAIYKVTNCDVLIDSSKSTSRALILNKIYTSDKLVVIHLIKEFSQVLNSNKKIIKKDIKKGIEFSRGKRGSFYLFNFMIIWILENLILLIYLKNKREVVPFRNYILNPDKIFNSIHEKVVDKSKIYNPKHMMAGNYLRLKNNIEINKNISNKPLSNLNILDKTVSKFIDNTFYKVFIS